MAYNDPFSDPFHRTYTVQGVSGFIDGIPMKIGDKFKPPAKVMLPIGFQMPNVSNVELITYDFSLEKTVIDTAESQRKASVAEQNAKTDHIADTIEEFTRHSFGNRSSPQNGCDTGFSSGSDESPPYVVDGISSFKTLNEPVLYRNTLENTATNTTVSQSKTSDSPIFNIGSDILLPEPITNTTQTVTDSTSGGTKASFNISDFETVDDPFEQLELKTLNDREELASLFGPVVTSASANVTSQIVTSQTVTTSQNVVNLTSASYRSGSDSVQWSSPEITHQSLNGPNLSLNEGNTEQAVIVNLPRADVTFQTGIPKLPPISGTPEPVSKPTPAPRKSTPEKKFSPVGGVQVLPVGIPSYARPTPPTNYTDSGRHVAPPPVAPKPSRSTNQQSTVPVNHSIAQPPSYNSDWNRYSPLPPSPGSYPDGATGSRSRLPDPYMTLNNQQRTFVDNITSMGFPKGMTARAVKRLGVDDKAVVDFLISVNKLTEVGYHSDSAEDALNLSENNVDKAEEFLKMLKELVTIGYSESTAKDALVIMENDKEKTMDFLVALGELRQLGFQETKIKEALLKYESDRDQALDYLMASE